MRNSTIHNALDQLDELYIAEGIELYEQSLIPHRNKKILVRVLLISALLIFSAALLLMPWFLTDNPPASSSIPSPSPSIGNSSNSPASPPSYYDPYTLIDFEILQYDGHYYLYFPESAQKTLQVGSSGKGPDVFDATTLPEFDERTTFFPFESVSKMVEMFTADSQMPLWFAEYILEHFPKSGDRVLLPDFANIKVPSLPSSFRLGKAYLSGEYYCIQILSDHFTNGLFNCFASEEEYADHYEEFYVNWSEAEGIRILKTYTEQTDDLTLTITDYLLDGLKYKRVQTTMVDNDKTMHVIATFPFLHLGSTAPVGDDVLPEEITLYIEENGSYGNIYLTQFGKNLTSEELWAFGIENFLE